MTLKPAQSNGLTDTPAEKFRKSTEQDLERMNEICACARDYMAKTKNPSQWAPANWPPAELLRSGIRIGISNVCDNDEGKVIGTFCFTQGPDIEPTYKNITEGKWLAPGPCGVIPGITSEKNPQP